MRVGVGLLLEGQGFSVRVVLSLATVIPLFEVAGYSLFAVVAQLQFAGNCIIRATTRTCATADMVAEPV